MSKLSSRRIDVTSMNPATVKGRTARTSCKASYAPDRSSIGSPLPPVSKNDDIIEGAFPAIKVHRVGMETNHQHSQLDRTSQKAHNEGSKSPMARRRHKQDGLSKIKTNEFPSTMDYSKIEGSPSPLEPWSPSNQSQGSLLSLSHPLYEKSKDGKKLLHFSSSSSLSGSRSENDISSNAQIPTPKIPARTCPSPTPRGHGTRLTPLKPLK